MLANAIALVKRCADDIGRVEIKSMFRIGFGFLPGQPMTKTLWITCINGKPFGAARIEASPLKRLFSSRTVAASKGVPHRTVEPLAA